MAPKKGQPQRKRSSSPVGGMDGSAFEQAERELAGVSSMTSEQLIESPLTNVSDLFGEYLKDDPQPVDIITFCTAEWGLGAGSIPQVPPLLPSQRFLLKAYYGMQLDDTVADIEVKDYLGDKVLHLLTEKKFHAWLQEENRTNVDLFTGERQDLVLVAGRRGTKTTIVSFIVCYELYKLLLMGNPHAYFNIIPTDLIEIVSVSTNEGQAKNMFDRITGNIEQCPFFKPFMTGTPNKLDMTFQTKSYIEKYGKGGRPAIRLVAKPCSAKGLRGPNNIIVVLDEAAYFFKEAETTAGASNQSDTAIYGAVRPAMAGFKYKNGKPAGRMIMISSPADRTGKFYDEYERSLTPGKNKGLLMFKLPTWVMNPTINTEFLEAEFNKDPVVYGCEYGGEFSDRLRGWIEDARYLRNCVVPGLKQKERSLSRTAHFLGFDGGLINDGSAVVVVHVEPIPTIDGRYEPKIEVDFAQVRYAWLEKGMTGKSDAKPRFTPDEILEWVASFTEKYNIVGGLTDHFMGPQLESYMMRKGFKQFRYEQMTQGFNSQLYQDLMTNIISGNLRFPEGPVSPHTGQPGDSDLVKELLSLQATHKNKYQVSVHAPDREGCHDDLCDALALAVHLAYEYINKGHGTSITASTGRVGAMVSAGYRSRAAAELRRMENKRSPYGGLRLGMRFPGGPRGF